MKRRYPSIDRDSFQKQIVSNWFRCGPLEAPPWSKTFRFLLNLMMNHRRTPSSSSLTSQSNVNLECWRKERLSFIMFCITFKKEAAVVSLIVRPGSRTHIAGELIKALLLLSGVSYSWFYYMLPCCWWLSVFCRVRILVLSLPCRIIPIHSYSMDWQFLICIFTASRACPFCLHLSLLLFVRISLYCTGSFHFQVQSQSGGKKVNLSLKLTATITTGRVSSSILLLYIECWPLLLNSLTDCLTQCALWRSAGAYQHIPSSPLPRVFIIGRGNNRKGNHCAGRSLRIEWYLYGSLSSSLPTALVFVIVTHT